MNVEKSNGAATISGVPSTPTEWTSHKIGMLDSTQDSLTPGPHVPGAFLVGEDDSGDTSIGEMVASVKAGLAGYFGVAKHNDTYQGQNANLSPTSAANIKIHEPDSSSASSSTLRNTTPLDVFPGPTQSPSVFGDSTPTLASCAATENAPISPNIPATPYSTPILGSNQNNAQDHSIADEGPASTLLACDRPNEPFMPFTPIPPVNPSHQYFPVLKEVNPGLDGDPNTHSKDAHTLLTHAGTHANGHTDAEDAQRAAFTHTITASHSLPSTSNIHGGTTHAESAVTTVAAAGHVFTAGGVHVPTTIGAAQVAHAGAFTEEGNHQRMGGSVEGKEEVDERVDTGKKDGKASRLVAKLKEKMHVG
ncbi:hypothetical protein K438DRAFT_2009972 [Mycena galopus ATCC 62051]|nr:hypothetical protein K438DRAFT_2009972 [Mycena galopus ATCC 62051]